MCPQRCGLVSNYFDHLLEKTFLSDYSSYAQRVNAFATELQYDYFEEYFLIKSLVGLLNFNVFILRYFCLKFI